MSATALVQGKLLRDPERKMSKAGKLFITAVIREGDGDGVTWWSILAFAEPAIEELSSLRAGDALAASGSFKAEIFEKGGTRRISFTLFADKVLSAKRQKREKPARQAADPQAQSHCRRFDDEIPL